MTSPDVSSRDETLISGRGPVLRLLACWLPWNQQRSAGEFVVFTWFQCSLCVVDLAERFRYSESDLSPSSLLLSLIPVRSQDGVDSARISELFSIQCIDDKHRNVYNKLTDNTDEMRENE